MKLTKTIYKIKHKDIMINGKSGKENKVVERFLRCGITQKTCYKVPT